MAKNKTIFINKEPIKLGQILKLLNLVDSGFESKNFLSNNEVFVNGKKEIRRGRKIYFNFKIEINDFIYVVLKTEE